MLRVVERLSSDCDDHLNCRQSRQILWPSSMGMEQHHAAHSVWFVLAVFCSTSSAPPQTVSQLLPATPIWEQVKLLHCRSDRGYVCSVGRRLPESGRVMLFGTSTLSKGGHVQGSELP